jgi:putative (di)nucleoside polyphosphate hydrolase
MTKPGVPAPAAPVEYRPGVGIMLVNSSARVLVGKRIDTVAEAWQMPQGGIDPGETPQQAAMRELQEEVGTDKVEVLAESRDWYRYELPEHLIGQLWGGRYRGQVQKWFVMRFVGSDADINIATDQPEFDAWKWLEPARLPDAIVPFKRDLYRELLAEFAPYLSTGRL